MTPKKVLAKTEALLQRGWEQGNKANLTTGPHCLSTAAVRALYMQRGSSKTWARVSQAICDEIGAPNWHYVMYWNDDPRRTKDEVIAAVRNSKRWLNLTEVRNSKRWLNLTEKERFFLEMHEGWKAVGALPPDARFRRP